jgi:hypothetical protein
MSAHRWHDVELMTILAERPLKDRLSHVLEQAGLTFSISEGPSESFGSLEVSDWADEQIRIDAMGDREHIDALAQRIAERYFAHSKIVLYCRTVRVLRPEKFQATR